LVELECISRTIATLVTVALLCTGVVLRAPETALPSEMTGTADVNSDDSPFADLIDCDVDADVEEDLEVDAELSPDADPSWAARVAGTLFRGLRVRSGPGTVYPILGSLPEGARVNVAEGPQPDDYGSRWYLVTGFDASGTSGWSDGDFLRAIDPNAAEPAVVAASLIPSAVLVQSAFNEGLSFAAKLTAYTNQVPGDGAHGTITKSGTSVRWGVVAVDPGVVPLGTPMSIEGFDGVFFAEDTGGGVRGNHVDIYFPDYASAVRFGVQYRTITLLR
jgi:3D (Asp-Asp-Asp) domain-containing protein